MDPVYEMVDRDAFVAFHLRGGHWLVNPGTDTARVGAVFICRVGTERSMADLI